MLFIFTAHQVILNLSSINQLPLIDYEAIAYLVAACDVSQVFNLELFQKILLGYSREKLWLSSEMITVLVIILVLMVLDGYDHGEADPVVVGQDTPVEGLRVLDTVVVTQDNRVTTNTVVDIRQLLAEVLWLNDISSHGLSSSFSYLTILVMVVTVTILPVVHEE